MKPEPKPITILLEIPALIYEDPNSEVVIQIPHLSQFTKYEVVLV